MSYNQLVWVGGALVYDFCSFQMSIQRPSQISLGCGGNCRPLAESPQLTREDIHRGLQSQPASQSADPTLLTSCVRPRASVFLSVKWG